MNQYVQFITSERLWSLHPVIHALIAHFFLVTIHPSAVLRAGEDRDAAYDGLVADLRVAGTLLG